MDFMNAIENELNITSTENGAKAYKSTGNYLVDLNFSATEENSNDIAIKFLRSYNENSELTLRWLFYLRDVRGGLGMRQLFRDLYGTLPREVGKKFLPLIAEYGRFDDLLYFFVDYEDEVYHIVKDQLMEDLRGYSAGKPISLLAKWLPSVNTSSEATRIQGRAWAKKLGMSEKNYRKMLSKLRTYIDVIEKKMSANKWEDIKYEAVPAKASMNYRDAFERHDKERYNDFLNKGKAKVSTIYPFEIFSKVYHYEKDKYLENAWNNLPTADTGNTLVVADGSGSMTCGNVFNSKATPWDVAHAMAFYFAERAKGCFKNKYITFSSQPEFVSFPEGLSLSQKKNLAEDYADCSNTNIYKTFMLILQVAIINRLKQEDIPENIIIISDMEFDEAKGNITPFEAIQREFAAWGYKVPRLIFWNVSAGKAKIPVQNNESGLTLVSGYSIAQCEAIIHGKLDPYENLVDILNSDRYSKIRL